MNYLALASGFGSLRALFRDTAEVESLSVSALQELVREKAGIASRFGGDASVIARIYIERSCDRRPAQLRATLAVGAGSSGDRAGDF
jgi:hypothetical protein